MSPAIRLTIDELTPDKSEDDHPFAEILEQASRIASVPREKNLFSLGARGHFENPTSDLLAFFLNPTEDHHFGSLFLDAFVACLPPIGDSANGNDSSYPTAATFLSVQREQLTVDGKFIDLFVEGSDWLLLIENKIHSGQGNPFDSYKKFAESESKGRKITYVVLCPSGESLPEGWLGVSYKALCDQLKARISLTLWHHAPNKWSVFAREFILHLDTLLYRQNMKAEDFQFVLGHLIDLRNIRRLANEFLDELRGQLESKMREVEGIQTVSTATGYGWGSPESWVIRCYSPNWGASNIAFFHSDESGRTGFQLTVYAVALSSEQIEMGHRLLGNPDKVGYSVERSGGIWSCWRTTNAFQTLEEATKCLKDFTTSLDGILHLNR